MLRSSMKAAGTVIVLSLFAHVSAQEESAEKLLKDYFAKNESFYDATFLKYQGQQLVDSATNDSPKFRFIEGMIAISKVDSFLYAAQEYAHPDNDNLPSRLEYMELANYKVTKDYAVDAGPGDSIKRKQLEDGTYEPLVVPVLQPHGLAMQNFVAIPGDGTDFRKWIDDFARNFDFDSSRKLDDESILGKWLSKNRLSQIEVTFDANQKFLPVKMEAKLLPCTGIKGDWNSSTTTKWKQISPNRWAPIRIEVSGTSGPNRYDFQFEFDWMNEDEWKSKINAIDKVALISAPREAWWREFKSVFED